MKKILIIITLISSMWSLDITEAIELGLAKKVQYMDTKQKEENKNLVDEKLDIALVYLKYLEDRQNMYITDLAIKKMKKFKDSTEDIEKLKSEKMKLENTFLDTKSFLESLINQKIEDINNVKGIKLSQLKNDSLESKIYSSLENSKEISSLERELQEHDAKKSDSSWNFDVSGDVRYRYDTAKRSDGRKYRGNEVELGLSLVLSKNNNAYQNDSTIEIAKKRADLEKQKMRLESDIKSHQEEYVKALKEYKQSKESLKKYTLNSPQEIEQAYSAHMENTKILYNVYRKYARLLHLIEKD